MNIKRIAAALTALIMVLSVLPLGVFAGADSYSLWVGETEVTGACLSGEGWEYEPSTNTLTLDNFSFEGAGHGVIDEDDYFPGFPYKRGAVYYEGNNTLNLVVKGGCTLVQKSGDAALAYGFYSAASLNVSGDGTLAVSTGTDRKIQYALYTEGDLTVNKTKIRASAGSGLSSTFGIYSYRSITLTDADVVAEAGAATNLGFCYGIETGILTVDGGKLVARTSGESGVETSGIDCYSATFKNCDVVASGGDSTWFSAGIMSNKNGSVVIEDTVGSFIISGKDYAVGMYDYRSIDEDFYYPATLKNAIAGTGWYNAEGTGDGIEIPVSTSDTYFDYKRIELRAHSYDLWVGEREVIESRTSGEGWSYDPSTNTLTLDGFSYSGMGHAYDAQSNAAITYLGTEALNVVVENENNINIGGELTDKYPVLCGIYSRGPLEFSGTGSLESVVADEVGEYSSAAWGIRCDSSITVDGPELTAECGVAWGSCGIEASGDFTVKSGKVNARAGENYFSNTHPFTDTFGISCGDFTVSGGEVIATGGTNCKASCGIYTKNGFSVSGGKVVAHGGNNPLTYGVCKAGSAEVSVSGGTVEAVGGEGGVKSVGIGWNFVVADIRISVGKDVESFVAAGYTAAGEAALFNGTGAAGKAWTDFAGTEGGYVTGKGGVFAMDDDYKRVEFPYVEKYDLWIGTTRVTENNTSGEGWEYTPSTNTLTLDNFSYTGSGHEVDGYTPFDPQANADILYSGSDTFNVVLKGKSTVTQTNESTTAGTFCGLFSSSNLNITGEGELDVVVPDSTVNIHAVKCRGALTVNGCKMDVRAGDAQSSDGFYSDGFYVRGALTFKDADVNVESGDAATESAAIYSYEGTCTFDGGKVTARSGKGSVIDYGYLTLYLSEAVGSACGVTFKNCEADLVGGVDWEYGYAVSIGMDGDVTVEDNVKSFVASGNSGAINGSFKNGIAGLGWDNKAGEGDGTEIPVNTEGAQISYKRVELIHTHVFTAETVADKYFKSDATCTAAKTYYKSCTVCGLASDTATFTVGEPNDHVFTAKRATATYLVHEANCTEPAEYYFSCANCDAKGTETFTVGNENGHTFTAKRTTSTYLVHEATCTEPAEYYYSCKNCDAKGTETFTFGSENGHEMGEWETTKDPTCTETGTKIKKCANCDYFEEGTIDALGHDYEAKVTPATCDAAGFTTYVCTVCGDSFVSDKADEVFAPLGHEWDDGNVTKEPTENAEGVRTFKCKTCGETKTVSIPKLAPKAEPKKEESKQTGDNVATIIFIASLSIISGAAVIIGKKKVVDK